MTTNKTAGRAWELEFPRYMRERGFTGAESSNNSLSKADQFKPDLGDTDGITDWTIELSSPGPSNGRFDLPRKMDQLSRAMARTGTPYGMVVRKRKFSPTGRAFCIVELEPFAGIMRRLDEEA